MKLRWIGAVLSAALWAAALYLHDNALNAREELREANGASFRP